MKQFVLGLPLVLLSAWAQAAEQTWPTWEGWELMGSSQVFSYEGKAYSKTLLIATSGKVQGAALRKDTEQPLTPDLQFSWQWQVASIPSSVAEDTKDEHHYIAASVIFDNGKNLSYIWSAKLPKGFGFPCPLDEWKDKETHVVVESGPGHFNQVRSYVRSIEADYVRYVGGPLPTKVVKVWIVVRSLGGENPATAKLTGLRVGPANGSKTSYL